MKNSATKIPFCVLFSSGNVGEDEKSLTGSIL
jgi:hypothetical protein